MQALVIPQTESSPKVVCDPSSNIFEISGDSRPENAKEFFAPLLEWIDDFSTEIKTAPFLKKIIFKCSFDYLNSISIKYVYEMLKRVETLKTAGADVQINWYYNKRDEDIRDNGNEFMSMINIPMQIIPVD